MVAATYTSCCFAAVNCTTIRFYVTRFASFDAALSVVEAIFRRNFDSISLHYARFRNACIEIENIKSNTDTD